MAAATTVTRRLVEQLGEPYGESGERLFPTAEAVAGHDPESLPMPRSRGHALVGLCRALADDAVPLDRSLDRAEVRARLLALPGIGPWTADYIALRALGHPDVFLPTDVGVRNALAGLGVDSAEQTHLVERSAAWAPWRSYALLHLWSSLEVLSPDRVLPLATKET